MLHQPTRWIFDLVFRTAIVVVWLRLMAPVAAAQSAAPVDHRLRVFLDCQDEVCDQDFTRRYLTYIDFVRDRTVADIHILVTYRSTAAGGREYEVHLTGDAGPFVGTSLTLRVVTDVATTDDVVRHQLGDLFKAALAPFVAQTPDAAGQAIAFQPPATAAPTVSGANDPWNHWVFTTSLNGTNFGEQTYRSGNLTVYAAGNRVTERWKLNNILSYSRASSLFKIEGVPDVKSLQSGLSFDTLVGRSVSEHWSIGADATIASSSFLNETLYGRAGPLIEYDLFPYDESSTRQAIFQYGAGIRSYRYTDETIFLKTQETLGDQLLRASVTFRRPWGTASFGSEYAVLLPKTDKYHVTGFGNLDLRVAQGLSFRVGGSVSSVHDQIYLAREGASIDEILLRQRQLATSYSYVVTFGVQYTFGSIFNSIVNPRFLGVSAAGY